LNTQNPRNCPGPEDQSLLVKDRPKQFFCEWVKQFINCFGGHASSG